MFTVIPQLKQVQYRMLTPHLSRSISELLASSPPTTADATNSAWPRLSSAAHHKCGTWREAWWGYGKQPRDIWQLIQPSWLSRNFLLGCFDSLPGRQPSVTATFICGGKTERRLERVWSCLVLLIYAFCQTFKTHSWMKRIACPKIWYQ